MDTEACLQFLPVPGHDLAADSAKPDAHLSRRPDCACRMSWLFPGTAARQSDWLALFVLLGAFPGMWFVSEDSCAVLVGSG